MSNNKEHVTGNHLFSFISTSSADTKRGLRLTSLLVLNFTFSWYILWAPDASFRWSTYCCSPAVKWISVSLSARYTFSRDSEVTVAGVAPPPWRERKEHKLLTSHPVITEQRCIHNIVSLGRMTQLHKSSPSFITRNVFAFRIETVQAEQARFWTWF